MRELAFFLIGYIVGQIVLCLYGTIADYISSKQAVPHIKENEAEHRIEKLQRLRKQAVNGVSIDK